MFYFVLVGLLGAIIADIVKDNCLELPKLSTGKISLGFLGPALLGAMAGFLADNSILTSFTAGFTANTFITSLIPSAILKVQAMKETPEQIISRICSTLGVDASLALRVAKAESGLNPSAVNVNSDGSLDVGLFQINSKWHPSVSMSQALDPEFSATFFANAVLNGNLSWWNATRAKWEK